MTLRGRFVFDGPTHRYRVGGVDVPSVTTIVKVASRTTSGPWFTEDHRARGTVIHRATLEIDSCEPGTDRRAFAHIAREIPAEWLGYFNAYCQFRTECRCQWREMEQPRVHRQLGFAGTPDRIGSVNGYPSLLEIKTGYASEWHPVQTAGQLLLLGRRTPLRRYVVYLTKDGRYRLREHSDSGDVIRFLGALGVYYLNGGRETSS